MPCNQNSSPWTPELEQELRECIDKKMSAGEAGRQMHMTRMACSGKAFRLGLKFASDSIKATRTGDVKGKRKPPNSTKKNGFRSESDWASKIVSPEIVPHEPSVDLLTFNAAIPVEQLRTILELTNDTCKFPVGEPTDPDFFFCGGVVGDRPPYCCFHAAKSFNVPPPRRGSLSIPPRGARL